MKKHISVLILILGVFTGCKNTRVEVKTMEFCRDEQREMQTTTLNQLLNDGWIYRGPLNNNGINCFNILFERTVKEQ